MAKGYPLADPSQQGLLIQGAINQAFGNWVGTDMTLDMYIRPDLVGDTTSAVNYSFTWAKGEKLAAVIARTLAIAMPDRKVSITISDARIAAADEPGIYPSFPTYAQYIREVTEGKLSTSDPGVVMADDGQTVRVFEGTPAAVSSGAAKLIRFQDLLGQVTWAAPFVVTAKLVLRGDLHVGDMVQFPVGLPSTATAAAMPAYGGTSRDRDKLSFSGQFMITQMQHFGAYRTPDAMSWNTTIWASPSSPG
jgi:hypothetical protein